MLLLGGLAAEPAAAQVQHDAEYGSAADFKWHCERFGGGYGTTPTSTFCLWENGQLTTCDTNGKNCHVTAPQMPGGGTHVDPGTGILDGGGSPATPPANATPTAAGDAYRVTEDRALRRGTAEGVLVNDADPDGDALAAKVVRGPRNGTLRLKADGSFAYTPKRDFHGTDRFTYEVRDGKGGTATATATIKVLPRPE